MFSPAIRLFQKAWVLKHPFHPYYRGSYWLCTDNFGNQKCIFWIPRTYNTWFVERFRDSRIYASALKSYFFDTVNKSCCSAVKSCFTSRPHHSQSAVISSSSKRGRFSFLDGQNLLKYFAISTWNTLKFVYPKPIQQRALNPNIW